MELQYQLIYCSNIGSGSGQRGGDSDFAVWKMLNIALTSLLYGVCFYKYIFKYLFGKSLRGDARYILGGDGFCFYCLLQIYL